MFKEIHRNKTLGLEKENVEDVVGNTVHDFRHHGKADCGVDRCELGKNLIQTRLVRARAT